MMNGSKDLNFLLENMTPEIVPGEYVFTTTDEETLKALSGSFLLTFREKEAITVILRKETADIHTLSYEQTWGFITLSVHSDLSAIGFLAEITRVLAKEHLSVNVVSAYHHDHLFVPFNKTDEALRILIELSRTREK
jgi:hypothetical protein